MAKKVIILNGSPRPNGNTAALVDRFAQGAKDAGHNVERFDLQQLDLHPCLGCCGGGKDAVSPCVQKDGMGEVYPAYEAADVVVLASPLYYWSISAQLKTCFDRLFAVAECNPGYANPRKDTALLMAAEGNDFDSAVHWYEGICKFMGWKDVGRVLCGGVFDAGAIAGKSELDAAYRLGRGL